VRFYGKTFYGVNEFKNDNIFRAKRTYTVKYYRRALRYKDRIIRSRYRIYLFMAIRVVRKRNELIESYVENNARRENDRMKNFQSLIFDHFRR